MGFKTLLLVTQLLILGIKAEERMLTSFLLSESLQNECSSLCSKRPPPSQRSGIPMSDSRCYCRWQPINQPIGCDDHHCEAECHRIHPDCEGVCRGASCYCECP